MKKIFIHYNALEGCTLHRLFLPYREVEKLTSDLTFTFGYSSNELTFDEKVKEAAQHDIFIFNRLLPEGLFDAIKKANPNIKMIADMDDDWRLNSSHSLYQIYRREGYSEKIAEHIRQSDYVTCTTEYLAKKLKALNENVIIFPNALKAEDQFVSHPTQNERLRFGFIGGSTHMKDMEMLDGLYQLLPSDVQDKIQIVLCGFDKAYYNKRREDETIEKVLAPWENDPWVVAEKKLTNNYQIVSPQHESFLRKYDSKVEYESTEPYRRIWTKSIFDYATAYNDIDVLLVPLISNDFDASKSELKLIEASIMHKAAIVSDTMPYTICGINALERGGSINPNGNCLMIPENKGVKGWVKAITKLTRDSQLREMITNNLSKLTEEGAKYNLTEVAKKRIEFLQQI